MARNELSKSAMRIADLIRRKSVERTDKEIAESIGVDPSTLCRFKADHLDKFCAFFR
ncbi:CII family transcriptional regulator [Gallibacterium anatis]|uniref:CII family transcriptional regulator n=1 Tax=Gallibacterium anatis TaxID=750 RepID=UPI00211AB0F5|nr:CII family transcriptional regulator [Gallibacterium anatis]UZD16530.1 CII family transcriptional regulator [Gallibacterium anatis]WAX72119.1 CII family transcriptional regulator [Gallibacterium anatis]